MNQRFRSASSTELRRIWTGTLESKYAREEALWEYWRRVVEGDEQFFQEELDLAFAAGVRGAGNAVGELAQRGRIPPANIPKIRCQLAGLPTEEAAWALVQLNAREALDLVMSGAVGDRSALLEAFLEKGSSWAAIAAMPYLTPPERESLVAEAEQRKVFSRGQRHQLREAALRASRT